MSNTSLEKSKIRILLLEGVHQSAIDTLNAAGYTNIEYLTHSLAEDDLIEAIALQAELLELKARPDRDAEATVIEAKLDKGRGPVATVLIRRDRIAFHKTG